MRHLCLALLLTAGPVLAQEGAKPRFVVKADKGFLDDPFAIDGERVAVLRTDSSSFARIEVFELATGKARQTIELADHGQQFDRLLFVGWGLVVVTRDPAGGLRAQYFGADGKPAAAIGPAADFGVSSRGLIAWEKRGPDSFVVTQYALDGLAPVGKPRPVVLGKDGMVKGVPLKVIGWQDGYAQLVGQRPGGFDKKKDSRQPARAAVYDLLTNAFASESEIGDLMGWAYVSQLRRNNPNRTLLAVLNEDHNGAQLVDPTGRKLALKLAEPFSHYEPKSLKDQQDGDVVTFSLAIDPLNPDALARQKKDPTYLDFYRTRYQPAAGKAPGVETTRILRANLDERPVTWAAAPGAVAVLRKHKSFPRGGTELEVY